MSFNIISLMWLGSIKIEHHRSCARSATPDFADLHLSPPQICSAIYASTLLTSLQKLTMSPPPPLACHLCEELHWWWWPVLQEGGGFHSCKEVSSRGKQKKIWHGSTDLFVNLTMYGKDQLLSWARNSSGDLGWSVITVIDKMWQRPTKLTGQK